MINLIYIFLGVAVIYLVVRFINIYNNLQVLRNNIYKAFSNIDVLLKQRFDELTKLMDSTKGFMEYEKQVLTQITEARSAYSKARSVNDKVRADNMMSETLKTLFAVAENYPELKSSEAFAHFQNRITEIENMISDRREYFNESVNNYNIRIELVPDIFVAKLFNYKRRPMFKAAAAEKKDIKISL